MLSPLSSSLPLGSDLAPLLGKQQTKDPQWAAHVDGLLDSTLTDFFRGNVSWEPACEGGGGDCTGDMRTFKGFVLRWLANTGELCPWTRPRVAAAIRASTEAAVRTCVGGASGRACGMRWIVDEDEDGGDGDGVKRQLPSGDGSEGLPEEMNVMTALMTRLYVEGWKEQEGQEDQEEGDEKDLAEDAPGVNGITTVDTGGTSHGDPHAGESRLPEEQLEDPEEVTPFETGVAWCWTVVLCVAFGAMGFWICTGDPVQGVTAQDVDSGAGGAPPRPSTSSPAAEALGASVGRQGFDLERGLPAAYFPVGDFCESRRASRPQRAGESVARQRHG